MYTLVRSMHASSPGKEGAGRENGAEQLQRMAGEMFKLRGNGLNAMNEVEPGGRGKVGKYRMNGFNTIELFRSTFV